MVFHVQLSIRHLRPAKRGGGPRVVCGSDPRQLEESRSRYSQPMHKFTRMEYDPVGLSEIVDSWIRMNVRYKKSVGDKKRGMVLKMAKLAWSLWRLINNTAGPWPNRLARLGVGFKRMQRRQLKARWLLRWEFLKCGCSHAGHIISSFEA